MIELHRPCEGAGRCSLRTLLGVTDMADLDRRLSAIEAVLRMDLEPPLDRLSGIEHRLDALRSMMQKQGLSIGELARAVNRLETDMAGLKVDVTETKVGVQAILELLTNRDESA